LPHLKSKIVWSSRAYLVPKEEEESAPQCAFMFINHQLIVYTSGDGNENDRSIVWCSAPQYSSVNDAALSFLVLENDGVLSIYFHSNSTTNPTYGSKTNTKTASNRKLFPFLQTGKNSTFNYKIIPFVHTQPQLYCSTKASKLWNACYQKAIQKLPIIDVYSKKTFHTFQKVLNANHTTSNPTLRKITDACYKSYHKTMFAIQNAIIRFTHTSMYHPKTTNRNNTTNILCIWSTNGCTPFPILRFIRFAFIALNYQLIRTTQSIIHSVSNNLKHKEQEYDDYYDDDDTETNLTIHWITTVGKQMYKWGRNMIHDLFGAEEDDDFFDDEEDDDYMLHVYLRNKMNRWKDNMNHRINMPY